MSQNFDIQYDVDSSVSHIPFPITEDQNAADSPMESDEGVRAKSNRDHQDEAIDSQASDIPGTPGTPESTKDPPDKNDSTVRTKATKPVLGKIQAKKRLMAFANRFNVIPKTQTIKPKKSSFEGAKAKVKETNNVKTLIDELNSAKSRIEAALDIQEKNEQHSSGKYNKKRGQGSLDIFSNFS